MLNITIDTCIWLELLKVDFKNKDNYFEEFCFWIENKHITHIVPTNIIDEWNRHKIGYQNDIVGYFKKKEKENISLFKHNTELGSTYNSVEIEKDVQKRIERIDAIFSTHSEKAAYDDTILKEAGIRNLKTIAPNHKQDSYRDTINILSLIYYLKSQGYTNSIFTTLNYKDFCVDGANRFELHDGLKADFANANLTYEYFGELEYFGTKLFNNLRKELVSNSYQEYLKDRLDKETASALAAKKVIVIKPIENPDADFLENIKLLDIILAKKNSTSLENDVVKMMTERHESYRQYFLNNIGKYGLV